MIAGTISGGLTMNPIILGVINGVGIVSTNLGKMKNYKKKIEMTKIAFTTYEKILVELRSALRGDTFDKDLFIDKIKVIDEMIVDQTPLTDKFTKKYDRKFMIENLNKLFIFTYHKMIKTIINYVNYHYENSRKELKDFPFPFAKDEAQNECFINSCLISKYLYELYFRKNITLLDVMYTLNDGIFELFFRSNSNVLKNHLIFHYAFTKFKKDIKLEEEVYI